MAGLIGEKVTTGTGKMKGWLRSSEHFFGYLARGSQGVVCLFVLCLLVLFFFFFSGLPFF